MTSKFEFEKSIEDVNWDSDLYYDLTKGGYIKPESLLKDKELGREVQKAANLVESFLDAIMHHFGE